MNIKTQMKAFCSLGAVTLSASAILLGICTLSIPATAQTVAAQRAELARERRAGQSASARYRAAWNARVHGHRQRRNISDQRRELALERQASQQADAQARAQWNNSLKRHK